MADLTANSARKFCKLLETYKDVTDDAARCELFTRILCEHSNDCSVEGKQFKLLLTKEIARLSRIMQEDVTSAKTKIDKIRASSPRALEQLQMLRITRQPCQSFVLLRDDMVNSIMGSYLSKRPQM